METQDTLRGGTVWLIGAGPGDPELLTVKAARLIAQADAVVFDHLVGDGIIDLARADARRIYAGKEASNHTLPQESINRLLVDLAREGLSVVRLKGGDPFVFGRGGEELETLAASGIPFAVVPGVTAAAGCAAYSGFPLTHRDHAQSVTFVTGHLKDGSVNLDWPALARPNQTVVFYMGIGAAGEICRQMIRHGLPSLTSGGGDTQRHPADAADPRRHAGHPAATHRGIRHHASGADRRRQRRQLALQTQLVRAEMKILIVLFALFALPAHAYSGKELREDCLAAEGSFASGAKSPNAYQSQGRALPRLPGRLRRRLCRQRPPRRIGRSQAQRVLSAEERRPVLPPRALGARLPGPATAQSRWQHRRDRRRRPLTDLSMHRAA
jgi:uroporphyrin-III C-methyltransferase